jgi:PAS domain S-box-containing protein/putative nucleotidyltransferase with HDIG domain
MRLSWLSAMKNTAPGLLDALFGDAEGQRPIAEAFIDTLPSAVFYKSTEGIYVACNKAYAGLIGYESSDSVRGKTDFDLFPKRTADKLFQWDSLLLDGGGREVVEASLPASDGRELSVMMHLSVLKGPRGKKRGIVGTVIDLTEERRIEEGKASARAMAAAAEMAMQTIEGMIDPVIILDSGGRIEQLNRGSGELFGLDRVSVGKRFDSLFLDFSEEAASGLLRRCRDLGRIRGLSAKVVSVSGEIRHVSANISVLRDSQRVVDGFVLALHDVTGLLNAHRTMEAIINASEDAVFLVDGDDAIRAGNRALAERFGERPETLIGRKLEELPDEEIREVRRHFLQSIRSEGKPVRIEYEYGERAYYNSGFPIFDADGQVRDIAVFSYDITDRKQGERLQRTLYSISEAAYFAQDMRTLFRIVHRIVAKMVHSDDFFIVLAAEAGRLTCPYYADETGSVQEDEEVHDKIGAELVSHLLRGGKSMLLRRADLQALSAGGIGAGEGPLPREWLGVPLKTGEGATIGALVVRLRKADASYGVEEERILNFVSSQIAMAIERKRTEEELRRKNSLLKNLTDGTTLAFVKAVEIRDPYTAGHQQRVSRLSYALAEALGLDAGRREATRMAALLHDVGKISVPSELLSKPGKLSELEFQLIRQHPVISAEILKSVDFPYPIWRFVREHHEKLDGSGYPDGLSGNAISLESRIICVADVMDAMVSHRPYRPSRGLASALAEIRENAGRLYDPDVSAACLTLFESGAFAFEESFAQTALRN